MAHRFEPCEPKLRLRLADALGDGPHLPVLGGVEHGDAVGLAQLVGPQDDPRVAVELAHRHTTVLAAATMGPRPALTGRGRRSGGRAGRSRRSRRAGGRSRAPATAKRDETPARRTPSSHTTDGGQSGRRAEYDDQVGFAVGGRVQHLGDRRLVDRFVDRSRASASAKRCRPSPHGSMITLQAPTVRSHRSSETGSSPVS